MRSLLALLITLVVVVSPTLAQQGPASQNSPTVTYDTFCGKTRMEKQDLLKTMSTEQRATLWQTQIDRWRDLHGASLTADQKALLQEFRAIIPAALVRPVGPETQPKLKALETRLEAAFTNEQLRELDNYGPCLVKKLSARPSP